MLLKIPLKSTVILWWKQESIRFPDMPVLCRSSLTQLYTVVEGECPHLSLWSPLSCPYLPLERCCLILSSWKSENCAALSAPVRCRRVSGAIGWLVAGFVVIGCAAGRPASPGNLLGWGLMRS